MELKEKTVLITGASGGIGLSTARKCLDEGANVFLVDISESALKEAFDTLNAADKTAYKAADVSKDEQVKAYTQEAIERFGKIDVLFLNAGIEGLVEPITEYPEDNFDLVMDVNVKGVWLGMKHAFPHMTKSGGSVIITSSVAGLKGTPNMIAYTASKHATIGLMRVAALEGASNNIRVNSVHPGPVDNRMMRSLEEGFAPGAATEAKAGFEQMIKLGRYASNDDIANLVVYLSSEKANYITGCTYVVDGGLSLG